MSSGSESDEDFLPGEPEKVSEEESADDETDLQYEKELEHKAKKRKTAEAAKGTKKRRTRNGMKDPTPEPKEKSEEQPAELDPVKEKKREEDLWAKFLEGTEPKTKSTSKASSSSNEPVKTVADKKPEVKTVKECTDDNNAREKRIFEFAGETIVVENNVITEKIKTADAPVSASVLQGGSSRGRSGGLSSILGQLNKKDKLSTLEKSKLDWSTYKQEEGLDDEIQNHNKGKSGYLDRRDFLERADVRQYEIERDLRMTRRSNR